jgi:septum formation protein
METTPITLASASPRRRRLLAWLGVDYATTSVDTPEDLTSPLKSVPSVLARFLAAEKARAAEAAGDTSGVIVACDTIVVLDREVLGKPVDDEDAARMLRALSGRDHQVITGVAVMAPGDNDPATFAVTTTVTMLTLDDEMIAAWLARGEALGCAGAYNIEHHLGTVTADQCYQNVAGLPLCHLYQRLTRFGIEGLTEPFGTCDEACERTCTLGPKACVTPGL